jgi:hypothetical protein
VRHSVERYLGGQLRGAEPCKESREHGHGHVPDEGALVRGGYEKGEAGRLREEAEMLQQQLEELSLRLSQLGQ